MGPCKKYGFLGFLTRAPGPREAPGRPPGLSVGLPGASRRPPGPKTNHSKKPRNLNKVTELWRSRAWSRFDCFAVARGSLGKLKAFPRMAQLEWYRSHVVALQDWCLCGGLYIPPGPLEIDAKMRASTRCFRPLGLQTWSPACYVQDPVRRMLCGHQHGLSFEDSPLRNNRRLDGCKGSAPALPTLCSNCEGFLLTRDV